MTGTHVGADDAGSGAGAGSPHVKQNSRVRPGAQQERAFGGGHPSGRPSASLSQIQSYISIYWEQIILNVFILQDSFNISKKEEN